MFFRLFTPFTGHGVTFGASFISCCATSSFEIWPMGTFSGFLISSGKRGGVELSSALLSPPSSGFLAGGSAPGSSSSPSRLRFVSSTSIFSSTLLAIVAVVEINVTQRCKHQHQKFKYRNGDGRISEVIASLFLSNNSIRPSNKGIYNCAIKFQNGGPVKISRKRTKNLHC